MTILFFFLLVDRKFDSDPLYYLHDIIIPLNLLQVSALVKKFKKKHYCGKLYVVPKSQTFRGSYSTP